MTKAEATRAAKALCKKLGSGWKPAVWEDSASWRYQAELLKGAVTIDEIPIVGKPAYRCVIFYNPEALFWTDAKRFDTPLKAILHTLMSVITWAQSLPPLGEISIQILQA